MPDGKLLFAKKNIEQPQEIKVIEYEGKKSVYPKFQIYTANPDGSNQIQLTQCKVSCVHPVVTPDGRFILYQARGWNPGEEKGIWRINADGNNPVQLTDNEGDSEIQITPDGKTVFFKRYDSAERSSNPMKISIDGGEPTPITRGNGSESYPLEPQTFDKAKFLVRRRSQFDEKTSESKPKLQIVLRKADGTTELISEYDFVGGYDFKISPDEKWVVFSKKEGLFRLPLMSISPETKPEQILKPESGRVIDFSWSNDSETINYLLDSEKSDVFLIEDIEQNL